MIPYVADPDFTLYVGDVREVLATLPDESVHCVATSPPFYALRDYGVDGQIGLEDTPEEWADALVGVFRECRRVMRPDATLWIECGDSYNSNESGGLTGSTLTKGGKQTPHNRVGRRRAAGGLKPKDLLGQPWMLAFALRADGWYLRQCIVWHKPNGMPESATDRCTTNHSYVFLLSKQPRYWFDGGAIAEPAEWARWGDQTVPKYEGTDTASGWMRARPKAELRSGRVGRYQERAMRGNGDGTTPRKVLDEPQGLRNARSVWTIPTRGYEGAHFATWPEALAERIIKAGCPEGGTVLDPFGGSGTTALVARRHGRRSILIELNEAYARLAAERLSQLSLLADQASA